MYYIDNIAILLFVHFYFDCQILFDPTCTLLPSGLYLTDGRDHRLNMELDLQII